MRKYIQVLLVILSLLSLVSVLFYRHEYNRLRYVLEVLNFFGTPGGSNNTSCLGNGAFKHYTQPQPPPSWQRISNSAYVYSAFVDVSEDPRIVKAIAIVTFSDNLNYGCYLWYDDLNSPVRGNFSFAGIARKNPKTAAKNSISSKYFAKTIKSKGYMFFCTSRQLNKAPTGVTFYKDNNDETAQAYLAVSLVGQARYISNKTAVCVMPRDSPFASASQFLDFFAFHNVIGVQDFYVYGGEFVYNLLGVISRDPTLNMNVDSLQWNYPFITDYELMRSLAEADCLLRTKGSFNVAVALAWNQYFVPKYHANIHSILNDFDPDGKVPKFQLPAVLFCLEYDDSPKSLPTAPLIFRKSRYALPRNEVSVTVNRLSAQGGKMQKISREIAAVHWYTKCDSFDLKVVDKTQPKFDYSILRFSDELQHSRLMSLKANFPYSDSSN